MAQRQSMVAIDLGSSVIRVGIAQLEGEGVPRILGSARVPMSGMQKGVITDVEEAVAVVSSALDMAEKVAGIPVERAHVSINGSHIASQISRGVIAVGRADGEIADDDVARVINAAQAISLPSNREILHVLPQHFVVDGQDHIHDPVGMTGVRLEVEAHIIEGSAPFIKNVTSVLNRSGVHVEDFVFAPLAAASAVLEKRQKELGVVLVDLGAGTTSLVVYEENMLIHTAVLPLGSSHITNDIAIGLRTSIDLAEAVKIQYGTALEEDISDDEMVVVEGGGEEETVSRKEVSQIIQARLDEIFAFVDTELKRVSRSGLLPAGVIFTGGGAHLPGVVETAKKKLRLPARIGKPNQFEGVSEWSDDPAASVLLGTVMWILEHESHGSRRRMPSLAVPDVRETADKVRGWFKTFLP